MPHPSVTSSYVRGRNLARTTGLKDYAAQKITEKEKVLKSCSPLQKKYDYRTKTDNALPEFSNFVLVKASEPRYGTFDPC